MPVFVASLTAASRLSYFGLNDTVNAESMILPGMKKFETYLLSVTIDRGRRSSVG